MLQNPLIHQIKFMILFGSSGLDSKTGPWQIDSSANRSILEKDLNLIADNFFNHPSYLRIDGRHAAYFGASIAWLGDVKCTVDELRKIVRSKGYEVFLWETSLRARLAGQDYHDR